MSKFRQNPITKEWTIISTSRAHRPLDIGRRSETLSLSKGCPFCQGNEAMSAPEVYRLPQNSNPSEWLVRVVKNKFPITDFHEVVVHSPDHEKDFAKLPLAQNELVLTAYLDRYNYYKNLRPDLYVHLYHNSGKEAGASLSHPHSQLVVFNRVPPDVLAELTGAKEFWEGKGECAYCDLVKKEMAAPQRVVLDTDHFVALTAFESEWPYEVMILSKRHEADFGRLTPAEKTDLADVLAKITRAYDRVLSAPARNFWIHSVPVRDGGPIKDYYHWHLDLVARVKTLGGLELGAGIMVDDKVGPEQAAKELRKAL